MGKRKVNFAPTEHYHLYNRGVRKQDLFIDEQDYLRFLFLVIHSQSPIVFQNIGRNVKQWQQSGNFGISWPHQQKAIANRVVKIESFALMPNHFHLMVEEIIEGGISKYMHRIGTSYSMYFNTKYKMSGHLFQGTFKAVHVEDDAQLLFLSAYIHRNPHEISTWRDRAHEYPWSSYSDCVTKNRWGKLLDPSMYMHDFHDGAQYHEYVRKSGAKDPEWQPE